MQRAEHALLLRALEGPERRIEVFVDSKDGDGITRFFLERSAKDSNLEKFTYAGSVQAVADQQRAVGVQNRAAVCAAVPLGRAQAEGLEPIVARLAAATPPVVLSEDTIRRHLRALIKAGLVQKAGQTSATRFWREEHSGQGPGAPDCPEPA
jgi:hypothetical protein